MLRSIKASQLMDPLWQLEDANHASLLLCRAHFRAELQDQRATIHWNLLKAIVLPFRKHNCRNLQKRTQNSKSLSCISIYWLMEQWLIVYGSTSSAGNRLDCCPLSTGQHRCPLNKEQQEGFHVFNENCDIQIIHRDIKPSNILLDKEFKAVIPHFGLAKFIKCEDTV